MTKIPSILETLSEYQGKHLSAKEGRTVTDLQDRFILFSLSEGRKLYDKLLRVSLPPGDAFAFFSEYEKFLHSVTSSSIYFDTPNAFKDDQLKLYKLIYEASNLPDHNKLFFEFLIGLARFILALRLDLVFLKQAKLVNKDFDKGLFSSPDSLYETLNNSGLLLTRITELVANKFIKTQQEEDYWVLIASFLAQDPKCDLLAKNLLGLHYIPEDPGFVTLAQMLHWKGWGGAGSVLQKVFADDFPELLRHCIHYISHKQSEGFTQLIANVVAPLSERSDAVMKGLLKLGQIKSDTIRLCDVGSGPLSGMVAGAIRALQEDGYNVSLDALDICEFSCIDDIKKQHVYYDANNARATDRPPSNVLYNACCAGYVLHQLANPAEVLRTMLAWTKPGGFVMTKLIIPGARLQFAVVPINLVDRESYIGDFSLKELSIISPGGDVKFLCPLPQFNCEFPQSTLLQLGMKVWGLRIFTVIECSVDTFKQLCSFFEENKSDDFNQLLGTLSHASLFNV